MRAAFLEPLVARVRSMSPRVTTLGKEVQAHGLRWEQELCALHGMTRKIGYTAKVDLPAEMNTLTGVDVSIKASGRLNTVDMANPIRIYDAVASGIPYHIIVVFYTQTTSTTKRVRRIVELDLTNATKELFGEVTRDQLVNLDTIVKSVPQTKKPTTEEHTRMYEARNALNSGALKITIKCNSTQSRIQSSFVGFTTFMSTYPHRVVMVSESNAWRGGEISYEIVSGTRVFKKHGAESSHRDGDAESSQHL